MNKDGAFVRHNPNGKGLQFVYTTVEQAEQYSEHDILRIKERYKGTWKEQLLTAYRLTYTLEQTSLGQD